MSFSLTSDIRFCHLSHFNRSLVSNVAAGLELSFPPQLYAVIYAGVLACYLLIDLVLVRRLDRMTPAEVLKNRE